MEAVHKPKTKAKKSRQKDGTAFAKGQTLESNEPFAGEVSSDIEVKFSNLLKKEDIEEADPAEKECLLGGHYGEGPETPHKLSDGTSYVTSNRMGDTGKQQNEFYDNLVPTETHPSSSPPLEIKTVEDCKPLETLQNTTKGKDVLFCITEKETPISPSESTQIFTDNKQLVEGIDDEFEQLANILAESNEMSPFTDNQLLSIYRNEELESCIELINNFVDEELRGGGVLRHHLYDILLKYLRAREKQFSNITEIDSLLKECDEMQQRLWILEIASKTECGECQDGNPVEATQEYQVGRFDKVLWGNLAKKLATIREMANDQHSLYTYTCVVFKLQIDQFIYETCYQFSTLPHNAPVGLVNEHLSQKTTELHNAISVLFYFQRRPCKDQGFINETRQWLTKLVAVLLRVATWQDHIFLLSHVLRCPAGIGKWAVNFIQPPPSPFNAANPTHYLNHALATLSTIISPIKERESFVSMMEKSENESEDLWVIVDSEGEDEESSNVQINLRENDIVGLLNQVPFDYIFRQVLQFTRRDDLDIYTGLSSSQILRVFAMTRVLLHILEQGLTHYETGKHQQFTKRLASLVHHCAHYATDMWEAFKRDNNECHDSSLLERLQVEYNHILLCACQCLLTTAHKSTCQFIAVLPYSHVSLPMLWTMFQMILQPHGVKSGICTNALQWWAGVEELISSLPDAELYYILTSVANMALARTLDDWLFIKMVTSHLFQIGFINTLTRDTSYKTVRTLLGNLSNKYPRLISVIISKLKNTVSGAGNLSLYLIKELPLDQWVPIQEDFDTLENWLLICPFGSIEGSLARYILNNMQWGPNPDSVNELFLKKEMHYKVALLVVRVAILHCPESPAVSSTTAITDTVRQFANSISRGQTMEQTLSSWVWQMLFKLRLHLLDQPESCVWETLNNPAQHFCSLPTLDSPPQELLPIIQGVKERQVTALFVVLSVTSEGHSIPLLCNNGFTMLSTLLLCHRYFTVLVLLQHIVPLFLDCPHSLLSSEKFHEVIGTLISADKTFLKLAKNLISSEYPGIILKEFGDMIQAHLENYHRYNLSSPAPLAQIWLEVLTKAWPSEPNNTAYLMDIILRTAYLRPEIKSACSDILSHLLQNTPAQSKSKFSLSGWMLPNTPIMSLMPRTVPDTPWFALFALELEQYFIQTKNGLWRQLLLEMAVARTKISIDTALKKACGSLKIGVISSTNLPLYRWAQQALETPVDHPALPLIWQKFFTLFLNKVPCEKDMGCEGLKFFEGMSNLTFLKKLKKKIRDCKEYYESKCTSNAQVVSAERKQWLDKVAKLYTSFGLWLEEPRLQEAGIYLPALPPQYDPLKLNSIFQGDENPWYEYLDYEGVRKQQKENFSRWEKSLFRKIDPCARPPCGQQFDRDPVTRITKRLQSYDSPMPPPPLRPPQQVIPHMPREAFHNKNMMLESLKESFRALLNFANTFNLHTVENVSLDCNFLEMLPILYRFVETEVKLYAACDTHHPRCRNQPPMDSLNCAGPAGIRIKVMEIRVSEATDISIHNNRSEMRANVKRALQPPPFSVCGGSVHIESVVKSLEREWYDLRQIGDVQLMSSLQEVGVALFYNMTSLFTEQAATYPPLKQLITTCIETLGQSFISGDEKQSSVLLASVLETPSLSALLATHFTPITASPPIYINLYKTLLDAPNSVPNDLIFVLLTKFDIGQWLEVQKPRLFEHTQLIELVGKALARIGQNPPQESVMIHEVLRRHLCVLMMHDAPQHYGEVFTMALRHTESHSLSTDIWYDIINALTFSTGAKFRPHMSLAQVVEETAKYATQQTLLSHHEVCEICNLLTSHFTKERLQYGLYGLYPKYRIYVSPFTSLLGILGHALIVTALQKHGSVYLSKVCEEVWPLISGLFSPWLCPYFTQSLSQPTAAWIQQLTDDRSILLPWITGDAGHAHKMAAMFTETIRFLTDSLPGNGDVFSYLWQYYVTNYAHTSVKEHILSVMHSNLLSLPWIKFYPTVHDLDLMLKVSDSYVPYCHTLLGAIFINIKWSSWIQEIPNDHFVSTRIHNALLHLLIKLANEPNVRQSGKIVNLLEQSRSFHWDVVDCTNYEGVVNWYVMSYDPKVVLKLEEEGSEIDFGALELLKVAAGFTVGAGSYHPTSSRKRQVYVRAYTKLLLTSISRYKTILSSHQDKIENALDDMLTQIDFVVSNTGNNHSEAALLVAELLSILNLPEGSSLPSFCMNTILKWLSNHGNCVLVSALLRTLGTTVANQQILGTLMEACLSAVFCDRNGGNWSTVKGLLQDIVPRHPPLEETLINNGQLLSLYALVIKRIPTPEDIREEANIINNLTQRLATIKPSDTLEAKLALLFHLALELCSRQCDHNPAVVNNLLKIVEVANFWAEYRPSWGILGVIGIKKQNVLSNRCRVLCKALAVLILSQLPERKGELPIDQPQFIRTHPHSPGGITCNNMELGPSADTVKSLTQLEGMVTDKNTSDVKHIAELAVRLIKQPENSMHNAHIIYLEIAVQLYNERFLQCLKET